MGTPFDMYRGLPKQTPGLLTRDLRLASRHTSPLSAPKKRPGTTSGAPGESHNFVAVLFPFDGRDGLRGELVSHAADAGNLVEDAGGHLLQQRPVKLGNLGGHDVDRIDAADDARPLEGSLAIAHARCTVIGNNAEVLPDIETSSIDFLANDSVGLA